MQHTAHTQPSQNHYVCNQNNNLLSPPSSFTTDLVRKSELGCTLLQTGHILHHAKHVHAHFAAKTDFFAHINDGHFLHSKKKKSWK